MKDLLFFKQHILEIEVLSLTYFSFPIPKVFSGFFFHLIFAITRKNTLEEVKSVFQDPDASDNFDKLIF